MEISRNYPTSGQFIIPLYLIIVSVIFGRYCEVIDCYKKCLKGLKMYDESFPLY